MNGRLQLKLTTVVVLGKIGIWWVTVMTGTHEHLGYHSSLQALKRRLLLDLELDASSLLSCRATADVYQCIPLSSSRSK